jgi:Tol biopolymer transport system component/DNA-binding winged helix-turn-helix (wHTH) protein
LKKIQLSDIKGVTNWMQRTQVHRFGPFELDVRAGELRKSGIRLRIPDQSFQLLLLLLEHPGEVVGRSDIRLRLWPNDTVVDFDQSINATVRRLRMALDESADTPRYIETVAKRNYRFIGKLDQVVGAQPEPYRPTEPRFRLLDQLGAGGMGVVYRAEDRQLGRHVAVKFLTEAAAAIPESGRRLLEQEARSASALNHPNICTVFGVEDFGGKPGIVMELLTGETLAARLARGPLPSAEALSVTRQVAGALAEAHEAGIVHRDLKPSNIMVTRIGAKVLDFGLARNEDTTGTLEATPAGEDEIPGTLFYMSPEQMRGARVDARSDIFALGLVLYQMLSGRRAFEAKSAADLRAAVIGGEPAKLNGAPGVAAFVARCLEKEPSARWQSAREAGEALEQLGNPPAVDSRRRSRNFRLLATALVASTIAIGAGILLWRGNPAAPPPMRMVPLTTFAGLATFPSFSPDGERVAFTWSGPEDTGRFGFRSYIKSIGNGEPIEMSAGPNDQLPKWSPDGSQIAFQRAAKIDHELIIVPVGGGPERKIADMGIGLSWSPNGQEIAYIAPYPPNGSGALVVQNLKTGKVRQLTNPKPDAEGLVAWSPDGKQIAFARTLAVGVYELFVVPSAGGRARRLTFDKTITDGFAWTSDSRELVFASYRSGAAGLWRIRASGGTPEALGVTAPGPAQPAISSPGNRLAFHSSFTDSNIWQYERTTPGTSATPAAFGALQCIVCSTIPERSPRYSPDGRKIVYVSERSGAAEIWVADSDGRYPIQLTSSGGHANSSPRWSPDGHWIAYQSQVDQNAGVLIISAEGGKPRRLTAEPFTQSTPSWSHDGRWVYFASDRGDRQSRIWKAPFEGGAALQVTKGVASLPMESPDGERLYFQNREGHLASMPVAGGLEETIPELTNVTRTYAWTVSNDGIYFYHPEGRQPFVRFFSFASRRVTIVLKPAKGALTTAPGIDLSPDGRKLLFTQVDQSTSGMMLVENFR